MSNAIVVGSGPNGLACAAALARDGVGVTVLEAEDTIGGGARSGELTVPGLLHDLCSAVHPMAVGSPLLESLELDRHGLEWRWPEVDCAHPLDDGSAGVMLRSVDDTAEALGDDGSAWRRVFAAPGRWFDVLSEDLFRPFLHVPRHPLRLVRFGVPAALPAAVLARAWRTPPARALFGGVAAHALSPLGRPMSSSVGVALISACHRFGWPVARGGSQAITDALAAVLREHGGTIETGVRVRSLSELPNADAPPGERGRSSQPVWAGADDDGVAHASAGRSTPLLPGPMTSTGNSNDSSSQGPRLTISATSTQPSSSNPAEAS